MYSSLSAKWSGERLKFPLQLSFQFNLLKNHMAHRSALFKFIASSNEQTKISA